MIYSRWRPDTGGYDYFESSERVGLGDNLPTPSLLELAGIGAPSTDAGRRPATSTSYQGSGPTPVGCLMPLSRLDLAQSVSSIVQWPWLTVGLGAVALWLYFKLRAERAS